MSNNNRFLPNLIRGNTITEAGDILSRRRGSVQIVCQRCSRIEADLTDTTDNLSATDAELKASRQVISLLQRQLELFQVEKEGLEKLIVCQWNKTPSRTSGAKHESPTNDKLISCDTKDEDAIFGELSGLESGLIEVTSSSGDTPFSSSPDDIKKRLLKLIKTQLYTKDEEIVKLKSSLKEAQNEKEQLNLQVHTLEDDLSKVRTENSLLRENLTLRDQTIVSLSNELFEQSTGDDDKRASQRRQSSAEILQSQHAHQSKTIHKLSDTLEAYKKTNELLSQNVLKLTAKCSQIERREMETKSQAQEMEARCCQIQSKLLSLLKEIEQSTSINQETALATSGDNHIPSESIQNESVKLLIKRLLEDKSLDIPLSWKEGNKSSRLKRSDKLDNTKLECDELGFYIVASDDNKCDGLSPPNQGSPVRTCAPTKSRRALMRVINEGGSSFMPQLNAVDEACEYIEDVTGKSSQSVDSTRTDEARWRSNWDDFIKDFDKVNLVKSKEFKELLRCGVPQEYRCKIWKSLVDLRVGNERQSHGPDYFQGLLEPKSTNKSANTSQTSTKQCTNLSNPAWKQIELDLLRTLPNNKYFETVDSPGTVRLRRVLIAFAAHKPEVGYCQGMNRLAAVALLVLPEEEAFWCLVTIVEKIMPSGYYNDLWLAQVDSNVVMDFVDALMPNLAEHFRQYDIELSLFAWFLTIFVDGTPPALFLRLWDCFLYEGDKILFRVALALLKMHERELLQLESSIAVNSFLRSTINETMDLDTFFNVAFNSINPLPGRALRARRENHFQSMRANIKSFAITSNKSSSPVTTSEEQQPPPQVEKDTENDCDSLNEESQSSIISI